MEFWISNLSLRPRASESKQETLDTERDTPLCHPDPTWEARGVGDKAELIPVLYAYIHTSRT